MRKCIKCQVEEACPDWVINKNMAYCEECAGILHLGESKESQQFKAFHLHGVAFPDGPLEGGPAPGGNGIGESVAEESSPLPESFPQP